MAWLGAPVGERVAAFGQRVPPGAGAGGIGQPRDRVESDVVGTSLIAGRVVAAESGRPLRRVQVRVVGERQRGGRLASTDEDGRYEIPDLPAGSYRVTASKGGYVTLQFGQRHPLEDGTPVDVRDRHALEDVDFSLPRGGVITGAIVDEFGEPVAEALVQAYSYRFLGGQRRLVPADRGQTNDIGEYRLFGLPPGDYYVSAALQTFRRSRDMTTDDTGYAPTFYPGTPNASEANRVTVGVGQELAGVSFSLMPVTLSRLSGRVITSLGEPLGGAFVGLTQDGGVPVAGVGAPGARTRGDGSFTISDVTPGRYRIMARSGRGGRGRVAERDSEFGVYVVTVMGGDIENLVLTTAPGASAFGTIAIGAGAQPTFDAKSVTIDAVPLDSTLGPIGGSARARVDDDWSFEIPGLWGAQLIRASGLPTGWVLQEARLGGRDVTDEPVDFGEVDPALRLEVVLTSQSTEVTGHVADDQGTIADYTVILFADDPNRWGYRSRFVAAARPSDDGSFTIRNLPPARYLAIALTFVERDAWVDPEFLARLRLSARPFDLAAGGTVALDLELSETAY